MNRFRESLQIQSEPETPAIKPGYTGFAMKRNLMILATLAIAGTAHAGMSGFVSKLTLSTNIVNSDTSSQDFKALIDSIRKGDDNVLAAYFRYSYASQKQAGFARDITKNNWILGATYDKVINSKIDWYVDGSIERDRIVDLDLRQIYSAGLAYKLVDAETVKFKVKGGLSLVDENFSGTVSDSSKIGLSFGTQWYQLLGEKFTLNHTAKFIPSPDDFSDYLLKSDLGLDYAMTDRLSMSLRFLLDYDRSPAAGFRKDRTEWVLGVGYKF